VSLMHGNNETGVVHEIRELASEAHGVGAFSTPTVPRPQVESRLIYRNLALISPRFRRTRCMGRKAWAACT
jgi:hypothetical protein